MKGALEDQRPASLVACIAGEILLAGLGTLGGGMVLGREGPTVQIGGNIGRMVLDIFRLKGDEARHTLLATGAAAGWLRPLTRRWRVFCLLSKRCVRSFAIR
ncbi:voltage-gated ClC-type chloride channel EriC [Escherichia coli]|uniref:Voltage-gated ClC-type chloride channel EriC n=1 Tax=Escherichia coli TaxID=562 RepID=A0A376L0N7_ECOLX|nr:voltage-gated ClC-type chloride channel EriC [Escherichia coli]